MNTCSFLPLDIFTHARSHLLLKSVFWSKTPCLFQAPIHFSKTLPLWLELAFFVIGKGWQLWCLFFILSSSFFVYFHFCSISRLMQTMSINRRQLLYLLTLTLCSLCLRSVTRRRQGWRLWSLFRFLSSSFFDVFHFSKINLSIEEKLKHSRGSCSSLFPFHCVVILKKSNSPLPGLAFMKSLWLPVKLFFDYFHLLAQPLDWCFQRPSSIGSSYTCWLGLKCCCALAVRL